MITKLCGKKDKNCKHCRRTTEAIQSHIARYECIGGERDCPYVALYDGELGKIIKTPNEDNQ